jgi:hypothetical protein
MKPEVTVWMLGIAISDFMSEAPGVEGGPSAVRECFRAILSDADTRDDLTTIPLAQHIQRAYSEWVQGMLPQWLSHGD